MLAVPGEIMQLTPSWMTAALAARCPGAVVRGVRVGPVARGTNARAVVHLDYARGVGPASVFVKAAGRPAHRLALVALGALTAEARLAESRLALPLEHPRPYAAGVDRWRLATIVVMDDVAELGGRPTPGGAALSVREVADGLAGLAGLHAAYWDRPLPAALDFLRPWRLGRRWALVSRASLRRGLHRIAGCGGLAWASQLEAGRLERQFRASASQAACGPQTVLHGDPHPGNTYGLPGGRTGFYDWQLVRTGNWSHDVGYFLVGSLEVSDRRGHERELLAGYLEALRAAGVPAPDEAAAWVRYRATPAFGLGTWLHTLAFGSLQPREVCLEEIRRFATAYADLDTEQVAG